ncbi:unnamed protein product [Brassica oleracea]
MVISRLIERFDFYFWSEKLSFLYSEVVSSFRLKFCKSPQWSRS